ncbi:hypothetical protein [Prosthecobacter sp.]|uniref:hypothetical protein n=1 Tax=Prosthecobacter sp. TaxID=1965333 RepID=UPI0024872AFD|nr:hypothetical protein [Prosthecobacter sp.]MDI1312697.1 hypothetical protein [Prosthecobacter sp.]
MKTHLLLGLAPLLLIACDARVTTTAPDSGPDKVIEKQTTIITPPAATSSTEKTTTTTTETKK